MRISDWSSDVCSSDLLLRLHESRWIDDHQPVALAGVGLALQLLEHLSLHEAAAAGDIVGLGRPGGELEGALGAVDRDHFAGAGQRRLHGKAAGEGVAVEHADIAREPCRPGAVVALVVEPAGLLAAFQIGEEACAVLFQRNRSVDVRSEEHTSELQSLMRLSYAVFCLQKQTKSNPQ